MNKASDADLLNIAALLEDREYLGQCDGIDAVLKTGEQAASAIRELICLRNLPPAPTTGDTHD